MSRLVDAEYVLPLRWRSDEGLSELTAYLASLRDWIDVTVVDGSDDQRFAAHARQWRGLVRHLRPAVRGGANGKVTGVLTGIAMARYEAVVIADDDVRHDADTLAAMIDDLRVADLVRPQNHFDPAPWHARWDMARSLMNRGLRFDYPGTYAVRRSTVVAMGGYDADVLFENLELERTVRAAGGTLRDRPELFVPRRPPTVRHFFAQRVRQAYDSLAQPPRLLVELALLPAVICLRRRPVALLLLVAAALGIAARGRRRHGGRSVFPVSTLLWVPVWLAERAVTSWAAVTLRLRGGVPYAGTRLKRAATPLRTLRRCRKPLRTR